MHPRFVSDSFLELLLTRTGASECGPWLFHADIAHGHEEAAEKEQLLSDPKMIDWISSDLTKVNAAPDLKERLSMIDFLEEAITWKDNPNHENVLRAISGVILSDTFSDAPRDSKRQLVGDKIELFTTLSEEAPEEAAALTSRVQGTKLEPILNYAARRLPVKQSKSEGR